MIIQCKKRRENYIPLVDDLGDLMIKLSPTRPCQKRANARYNSIMAEEIRYKQLALIQKKLAKIGRGSEMDFGTLSARIALNNLLDNKAYIMPDYTKEVHSYNAAIIGSMKYLRKQEDKEIMNSLKLHWMTFYDQSAFEELLETSENSELIKKVFKTGKEAIRGLCDVKFCDTTKSLGDKFKRYGFQEYDSKFDTRRIAMMTIDAGTLILMGSAASGAYTASLAAGGSKYAAITAGFAAVETSKKAGDVSKDKYDIATGNGTQQQYLSVSESYL